MSLTITLVPVAIALSMSLGSSSLAALISLKDGNKRGFEPVETVFADGTILQKTLSEHGLCVKTLSENEYIVASESGTLRYYRNDAQSPFLLELQNVHDMQQLLDSLDSLENEYKKNVQAFTYDRVMASLEEHGMRTESESVLDDESILLTLSIGEPREIPPDEILVLCSILGRRTPLVRAAFFLSQNGFQAFSLLSASSRSVENLMTTAFFVPLFQMEWESFPLQIQRCDKYIYPALWRFSSFMTRCRL